VRKRRIVVGLRGRGDVCSCMIVCGLGMVSNSQLCRSLSDSNSLSFTLVHGSFIQCGRQNGVGQVFLRVLRFSPANILPPVLHTHLHLHVAVTRRTNTRSLGTSRLGLVLGPTIVSNLLMLFYISNNSARPFVCILVF
jgi:hypothetical protein